MCTLTTYITFPCKQLTGYTALVHYIPTPRQNFVTFPSLVIYSISLSFLCPLVLFLLRPSARRPACGVEEWNVGVINLTLPASVPLSVGL